ncbi:hypothetical protein BU16DRAFT_537443 [Lophium mytilinum]|uniref:Uncharacterized protein n=1 Tax=Lophium mytilinum TaxID=390894 RepID=A0A6A6R0T1_9PEZI|nr:hypothetical protein BU16DRAFT_537443 [Lophium mytilinum]
MLSRLYKFCTNVIFRDQSSKPPDTLDSTETSSTDSEPVAKSDYEQAYSVDTSHESSTTSSSTETTPISPSQRSQLAATTAPPLLKATKRVPVDPRTPRRSRRIQEMHPSTGYSSDTSDETPILSKPTFHRHANRSQQRNRIDTVPAKRNRAAYVSEDTTEPSEPEQPEEFRSHQRIRPKTALAKSSKRAAPVPEESSASELSEHEGFDSHKHTLLTPIPLRLKKDAPSRVSKTPASIPGPSDSEEPPSHQPLTIRKKPKNQPAPSASASETSGLTAIPSIPKPSTPPPHHRRSPRKRGPQKPKERAPLNIYRGDLSTLNPSLITFPLHLPVPGEPGTYHCINTAADLADHLADHLPAPGPPLPTPGPTLPTPSATPPAASIPRLPALPVPRNPTPPHLRQEIAILDKRFERQLFLIENIAAVVVRKNVAYMGGEAEEIVVKEVEKLAGVWEASYQEGKRRFLEGLKEMGVVPGEVGEGEVEGVIRRAGM